MSVTAYVGMPGSGKSYDVVGNVVIPALKQGRLVLTNLPLNLDEIEALGLAGQAHLIANEVWSNPASFDEVPGGAYVVLDEVWRLWPAGMKQNELPKQTARFFAEHRHRVGTVTVEETVKRPGLWPWLLRRLGWERKVLVEHSFSCEIVLVTQSLRQLAKPVKLLIEETFVHKRLKALGLSKGFRVDIYTGPIEGQSGPESAFIRSEHGTFQKKVYKYYKSQTQSEGALEHGREVKADRRGNIWMHPMVLMGIPAGLGLILLTPWDAFEKKSTEPETGKAAVKPVPVVVPRREASGATTGAAVVPVVPWRERPIRVLPASQEWRLGSFVYVATKNAGGEPRVLQRYWVAEGPNGERVKLGGAECEGDGREAVCRYEGAAVRYGTGRMDGTVQKPRGLFDEGSAVARK